MSEKDQREAEQLRERMTLCPGPSRAPVIGRVTPPPGKGEPIKYADDGVWEVVKRGRHLREGERVDEQGPESSAP